MCRYPIFHLPRWLQVCFCLFVASFLAGCATTNSVSARVTSFQQWPDDAVGQRYRFVIADPGQENNLEYQAYQDMVRAGIGSTGLVEAGKGASARFTVSFRYGVSQTQVMVRRPYDPYFYGGYGQGFYGRPGYWSGWGGYWGPDWVDVPAVAYRNALTLEIHDASRNGAEVYRASAYSVSGGEKLLAVMPYLVRAIFDGFPGNNGSEREVHYTVGR
jgi:hypothetical protein